MKQWNEIFKEDGRVFLEPQKDMPRIAKLFKKKGIKRILDLGCGSGRHTVYLAKNGFDVYGFDIAPVGINLAKKWLKQEKLKAKFRIGSVFGKLPYKDNFFDALISTQVINHAEISDIRKLIKEMERVLKPKGLIFITVMQKTGLKEWKQKNWKINSIREEVSLGDDGISVMKNKYKIIGPQTYVYLEGGEKGLIHYIFNKNIVRKEFKNFKIPNIWLSPNKRHDCFLGELNK